MSVASQVAISYGAMVNVTWDVTLPSSLVLQFSQEFHVSPNILSVKSAVFSCPIEPRVIFLKGKLDYFAPLLKLRHGSLLPPE